MVPNLTGNHQEVDFGNFVGHFCKISRAASVLSLGRLPGIGRDDVTIGWQRLPETNALLPHEYRMNARKLSQSSANCGSHISNPSRLFSQWGPAKHQSTVRSKRRWMPIAMAWTVVGGIAAAVLPTNAQSAENAVAAPTSPQSQGSASPVSLPETRKWRAVADAAAINAAALDAEAAKATDPDVQKELTSKAKKAYRDAAAAAVKATTDPDESRFKVFFSTGAKLENPYTISTNGSVKAGNSSTDGTIDFNLNARYIFTAGNRKELKLLASTDAPTNKLFSPFGYFPDLDLHFGFTFAGQSAPSNFVGSTIPGGSDLYSDNAIGLPFYRLRGNDFKLQSTIELAGGFVTDKKFISLHPNAFAGVGLQVNSDKFYWSSRLGIGMVDEPKFDRSNPAFVARDSLQNPEFKSAFAAAWGNAISYKLSDWAYAQVAANVYFTELPSWNITFGMTLSPGDIVKKFNQ